MCEIFEQLKFNNPKFSSAHCIVHVWNIWTIKTISDKFKLKIKIKMLNNYYYKLQKGPDPYLPGELRTFVFDTQNPDP